MKNNVKGYLQKFKIRRIKKRKAFSILAILSLIVASVVSWDLHITGITMAQDTYCGKEEHTHTEECYEHQLICNQEESEEHTHTDECYETVLVCEKEEHTHDADCYIDKTADVEDETAWKATLPELTGNTSEDVVSVASSQLGYKESTSNYDVETDSEGNEVKKGYSRYGQWYGNPYVDWNTIFVSFVFNYANVQPLYTETDPNALYQDYLDQITNDAEAGSILFFDQDNDGTVDHVGIVKNTENNTITTIEGDVDDEVKECSYEMNDSTIIGYVSTKKNGTFTLTGTADNGIQVTVTGDQTSLPCDPEEIEVRVQEVTDENVIALWQQTLEEQGATGNQFLLDVSLWYQEQEIEPVGNVKVTFSDFTVDTNDSVKVYHIDTDTNTVEDMQATKEDDDISLNTDHFSYYGGTAISGNALSNFIPENSFTNGGDFYLSGDAWTEQDNQKTNLTITNDTTINLNGHKLSLSPSGNGYFTVASGATLTIVDSVKVEDKEETVTGTLYGKSGTLEGTIDDNNNNYVLTYYVTESTTDSTNGTTTETLKKHTVDFSGSGSIVTGSALDSAIMVSGGTLNIQGGVIQNTSGMHAVCIDTNGGTITMSGGLVKGSTSGSDNGGGIYMSSGTLNMKGGYVAGGAVGNHQGGGIYAGNGTVNISDNAVIAANSCNGTDARGGGIYSNNAAINITGGVISGNTVTTNHTSDETSTDTNYCGGGGIYVSKAAITLSNGYITNNRFVCDCEESRGYGNHGGGGIAYAGSSSMNMSGGYVTGNTSQLAGGGIYAGYWYGANNARFEMTGGVISQNIATLGEGGGLRISGGESGTGTNGVITGGYITNNSNNTKYDWGGGGIFVQQNGTLNIKNALIIKNSASGFGGGVGSCPTGETVIVYTDGAAIYNNQATGTQMSGGGNGKVYDTEANNDSVFTTNGYKDFFCVKDSKNTIAMAVITGKMLGDGSAKWSGSMDGSAITISETGYAAPKYRIGLTANPSDSAIAAAKSAAQVYISGNSSGTHGGGIMTNGKLILGQTEEITTTTSVDFKGTKKLLKDGEEQSSGRSFNFEMYEMTDGVKEVVATATSDATTGEFTITPNVTYSAVGTYTYYLREQPGEQVGMDYDDTQYTITVTVTKRQETVAGVTFTNYYISNVKIDSDAVSTETKSGMTIHYRNSNSWNSVDLYVWKNDQTKVLGEWSGTEMPEDSLNSGWYTYTLTDSQFSNSENVNFIVNDGKGKEHSGYQTADLNTTYQSGSEVWVTSNDTYASNGVISCDVSTTEPEGWIENGNVSTEITSNADGSKTVTINPSDATFTNRYTPTYELPETGGTGDTPYTICGIALMTATLMNFIHRKRKKECHT